MNEYTEPDEIVNGPNPRTPRANRRASVIGLVAVGGLAAGGAALYVANSAGAVPSASGSSASGSSASGSSASGSSSSGSAASTASATCVAPNPGAGGRPGGGPGPGGLGLGPAAGNGADGRIAAVSSTSLTVRDLFAKSHTYKITSATVIHSGPARSVTVSALSVGEHVVVRTSSSTSTAADIDLHPARIDGSVSAVTSTTITVTDRDGFTRMIDTASQTEYTLNSAASSRSKITTGSVVHAEGKVDADGTALDAATVDVVTGAKAPTAGTRPCPPAGGRDPGGPGHRGGGPGAPKPSSSGTSTPAKPSATPPSSATPSATTTR